MKKHLKKIQVISACVLFCLMTGCDYAEKVRDVGEIVSTAVEKVGRKAKEIIVSQSIRSKIKEMDDSDSEIMDRTAMAIVTALEEEDVEAIKSLFSKEALENADDIDEQIQEAIDFYEGTMEDYTSAGRTQMSKHDGITVIDYLGLYTIETKGEKYKLKYEMIEQNDENSDLEGIMTIELVLYEKTLEDDFMWQVSWERGDYGVYIQR